jgi:hypothetical protein
MTPDNEMFDCPLGDRLVCVRYRYDEQQKKRCKTVELIVEEDGWEPPAGQWVADRVVQLWVILPETEVRRQVKGAGGRWDPPGRLWALQRTNPKGKCHGKEGPQEPDRGGNEAS